MVVSGNLPRLRNGDPIPPSYAENFPPGFLNQDRGPMIVKAATGFITIDTIMVTLRFLARWIQRSKFRADDYLVLAGLLFCWGLDANYICDVLLGDEGTHIDYLVLYPERYAAHQKSAWIATLILFFAACAMSKLAILYVYHSIFVNKRDLLGCKITAIFIILSTIVEIPIPIFQCKPVHGLWDLNVDSNCIDVFSFIRYGPIPNMLIDVALLVLPIPTVMMIQVPMRVKIGIFVTFLLASIGLIVCVVRLVMLFRPFNDSTWQGVPVILCTMAEATTYLMSACLLQIRPLLTFLFERTPLSKIRNWTLTTKSRPNTVENEHHKHSRWNNSAIGLHNLTKPSSKDDTPLTNRDGIVITNEFTVAYERGNLDEEYSSGRHDSIQATEQV